MILRKIPDSVFEATGTVVGFAASMLIALQIQAELGRESRSTLSISYVGGFMLIFLFWTVYGLRFKRIAMWLTNGTATVLQATLLAITLFR
ncbi:MAG: hypothetical protein WC661_06630 [Opitutaceae bacterium]|jgi:hypothetical protein